MSGFLSRRFHEPFDTTFQLDRPVSLLQADPAGSRPRVFAYTASPSDWNDLALSRTICLPCRVSWFSSRPDGPSPTPWGPSWLCIARQNTIRPPNVKSSLWAPIMVYIVNNPRTCLLPTTRAAFTHEFPVSSWHAAWVSPTEFFLSSSTYL